MIKILLIILSLCYFNYSSKGQQHTVIDINVSMSKKYLSSYDSFYLRTKFTTVDSNKKFLFRRCLGYNFGQRVIEAYKPDLIVEIEKKVGRSFQKNKVKKNEFSDDPIPCFDTEGNEMLDTVSIKKPLFYKTNLTPYYIFTIGQYRIRVKYELIDGSVSTIVYSNWVYFTLNKIPDFLPKMD